MKLQHTGGCTGTWPLPKVNMGGGRCLQNKEEKMEANPTAASGQALCTHTSPDPLQSPGFSQVWNVSCSLNLKKTIINPQNHLALVSNGIPSTLFPPFLSRLQVVPFGGFPCSFQRCTRLPCLYFSYTTKTTWNLSCPSLLGPTQSGMAAVKNNTISRVLRCAT